jgi:hypothetical protein
LKKNIAAVRQAAEATAAPVAPPKPVTDEDDDDDLFGFGNSFKISIEFFVN